MDYNKLNKKIELFENQKADLINQFNEYMDEFGASITQKYGLNPNAEKFANWFIDTHQSVLRKKRRLPYRLTREYVFQYCAEYKLELDVLEINQKITTVVTSDDNIYKDKVEKIFEEYIPKMKCEITSYHLLVLIDEISDILHNQQLPKKIEKLEINDFSAKLESIRFLYYQTYLLNKKTKIREMIITYMSRKFAVFSNYKLSSIDKKFSEKPEYFDKVK